MQWFLLKGFYHGNEKEGYCCFVHADTQQARQSLDKYRVFYHLQMLPSPSLQASSENLKNELKIHVLSHVYNKNTCTIACV